MAKLEVPLADPAHSPKQVLPEYYYSIPERTLYKSYAVYEPSREPAGYWAKLQAVEPEVIWGKDAKGIMHRPPLKTREDWISAGKLVFSEPTVFDYGNGSAVFPLVYVRTPEYFSTLHIPLTSEGVFPFADYVVRNKGRVDLGAMSCANCHTRVLPNGAVIAGAQGNFPFEKTFAREFYELDAAFHDNPKQAEAIAHNLMRTLFSVPWLKPNPAELTLQTSAKEIADIYQASPAGVFDRQGTSAIFPSQISDLIGVQERFYLDHTGLQRQHGPGDMMRYSSLNQDLNVFGDYGGFIPKAGKDGKLPDPKEIRRYSDEQLYALTLYLYSLRPPANPNPVNATSRRGLVVFNLQGCGGCHTAPLYTNNKLTLAKGFDLPADTQGDAVMPISINTDPRLATQTRRGTGYYKVPSLKGVWYRGPFEHNGSIATLEDWFDPARLKDDYVPTGLVGHSVTHRAVPGHNFGLDLPPDEKRALIAFLRTL